METWVAVVALVVAAWQLHLQRREVARNTRLEMFKIAADIIRYEIELREKIINDEKGKPNMNWKKIQPHIDKVNDVLRPAFHSVVEKIIVASGGEIRELSELPSHYVKVGASQDSLVRT